MVNSIHIFRPTVLVLAMVLAFGTMKGQTGRSCGSPGKEELYATPQGAARQAAFEGRIQRWIAQEGSKRSAATATYIIPTVIHVIQTSSTDLIPDACLLDQIDILNEDFQRLNSDTSLVPAEFLPVLGDGSIEFCLASLDPDGNPTSGITRTVSSQWANHSKADEDSLKALIQWPPTQYLNVWVTTTMSGGLLGYATFPTELASKPQLDGVAINGQYIGSGSCALAPYNKGRTVTHEIGHWLGLFHTFQGGCQGDTPSTCNIAGDNICDTPPTSSSNFGCPATQNTCNETPTDLNDMTMNYMDYTDDACMYMFSSGQVARMHAVLANERSVISSPANHSATGCGCSAQSPCTPVANFSADRISICPGQTVNFSDLSTGPASAWSWSFPGGTPSASIQQNPTVTYATPGSYAVTLTVVNTLGNHTNTINAYVTVAQGNPPPMAEGFEATLPAGWQITNEDNSQTWVITSQAASLGAQSIYIDNWNYDALGTADAVVSRIVDLSTYGSGMLSFDYAYKQALADHDTLQVLLSSDCGLSWDLVWQKGGSGLATVGGAGITSGYVPAGPGDFKSDSVDLSNYLGSSGFVAKFQNIGHEGNALWLDNINLSGIVGRAAAAEGPGWSLEVAPNPFLHGLQVHYSLQRKTEITFVMTDLNGREVYRQATGTKVPGAYRLQLPAEVLQSLPAGVYFLRGSSPEGQVSRKVLKLN